MAGATQRIPVQTTVAEKRAFEAKAKRFGMSVSDLLRSGARAYQSGAAEEELAVLADAAKEAAERAGTAIDDALAFIEESNARIAKMEAEHAGRVKS
jgi:hypothetical protein